MHWAGHYLIERLFPSRVPCGRNSKWGKSTGLQMFDWATSRDRGKAGLSPRVGENMDGYRVGRREASDPGSVGAGWVAIILIGCGLLYIAFVMITGPLLEIAVAGTAALLLSTTAFRIWPKLGLPLPFKDLFLLLARAYAFGFAAILALFGLGSLLHHAAEISILPYFFQVFSDIDGNRLETPYWSWLAPGLLSYLMIYVLGWAIATWVVWRRISKSEEAARMSILRISAVMGATFYAVLQAFRLLLS